MGFDCPLEKLLEFIYNTPFDNGLTEHEYLQVFVGRYNGKVNPDPAEVMNYKWVGINDLRADMKKYPKKYSSWLHLTLDRMKQTHIQKVLNGQVR